MLFRRKIHIGILACGWVAADCGASEANFAVTCLCRNGKWKLLKMPLLHAFVCNA
jgi:hypothetical protein